MGLEDGSTVELEYSEKAIKLKKKRHPLEDCIGLFDGLEFTEEDHKEAKKSLFGD